ncbi:hypothetical protein E4T44_01394 [Aureobasidium sp. EXF-8845]|nr:hypothetical protein E4T44_01394 [Aureobasidium sp. EXF-8845]KAI4855853.1 hypothetical protein E4T45_02700 [Aureobasidium sp. EXF-8846]
MKITASKGHWDANALSCILVSPLSPFTNDMIELRTTCGWRALVHKPLLCHYSTYYNSAICGDFQEATRDHFTLELDELCANWFIRWLYSGQLVDCDLEDLYHLYIFADLTDILALRRAIMNRLIQVASLYLPNDEIALPLNQLPSSAPLYKFLVEWYTHHWFDSKTEPDVYEFLLKEFLYLVMCGLVSRGVGMLKSGAEPDCTCHGHPCRFHEHESREEWHESKSVSSCLPKPSY